MFYSFVGYNNSGTRNLPILLVKWAGWQSRSCLSIYFKGDQFIFIGIPMIKALRYWKLLVSDLDPNLKRPKTKF
jgi:hypothetical protein